MVLTWAGLCLTMRFGVFPTRGASVFRRLAVSFAAIGAAAGLAYMPAPASAAVAVDIPQGTYQFSNYNQYFTTAGGLDGDPIVFTSPSPYGKSNWQLIGHGRVTADGNTFTPGSGLNAAFDGYTIWELYNPLSGLDAGGCSDTGGWKEACLNQPSNNYFIIAQLSGDNYYLVNVHASNLGYEMNGLGRTPWVLCAAGSGNQGLYLPWIEMDPGNKPAGSTLTAHFVP